ncbi:MAG: tetratricopeptide repeat protein [Acidobacteria bacterium]|nr:tetratricopeptide repeat protein [Acidobacteriota bacterium]
MARGIFILVFGASLFAQQPQEPPEEDSTLVEKTNYAFNPLQAEKELKIGDFYMKKASYKAATLRYREATKWNPGYADAWLKLGACLEKARDAKGAREAYAKYLELAPDAKNAAEIKKKL